MKLQQLFRRCYSALHVTLSCILSCTSIGEAAPKSWTEGDARIPLRYFADRTCVGMFPFFVRLISCFTMLRLILISKKLAQFSVLVSFSQLGTRRIGGGGRCMCEARVDGECVYATARSFAIDAEHTQSHQRQQELGNGRKASVN